MSEDSDQETTDFDIETRTWNKLETAMKLFGYREGAVQGKNLSLQEGFNLGYLDGFKLGEYIGICKGVLNCQSELGLPAHRPHFVEEVLDKISSQPCIMCLEEKNTGPNSKNNFFGDLEDIIKLQQNHNNEMIKTLKNSDVGKYLDQG